MLQDETPEIPGMEPSTLRKSRWRSWWKAISVRLSPNAQWQAPWLTNRFADGTVVDDGPIFSAFSAKIGLAVKVIERDHNEEIGDLEVWTADFGDVEHGDHLDVLIISVYPTAKLLEECVRIILVWCESEGGSPLHVLLGRSGRSDSFSASEPLDLNATSLAVLKSLPGIGDAYSKSIVAGRPYLDKEQLVSRKIIPRATYEKIKDLVIA